MTSPLTDRIAIRDTRSLRALILDDNEVDIMRLRSFCLKAGLDLEIDTAMSLADLRAWLDHERYDIVFLDYHLGADTTGIDALKELLAHPDQTDSLAIMVTSVTNHHTAVEAMRLGCADYIVKEELTVSALQKAIATAFERRVLLSAVSRSTMFQATLERRVRRFSRSCGPEVRGILTSMLRHIAEAKREDELDPGLRATLTAVERGAHDVAILLDDVATLTWDLQDDLSRRPARLP